jgi:predicted RNA-binding protein YlxR (DUF448 family)/ribosomal protein L7Ae-like RNA K-turn-binding protein
MKRKNVQTETTQETKRAERPAKPGPTRTCVGCGRHDDAASLVRVVLGPPVKDAQGAPDASVVAVDMAGGSFGRGAHVHARKECLINAAKGGFARAFKCRVDAQATEVAAQIVNGCERRIAGLLMGARRAGHLAIGADAATAAMAKGAPCLVVATDAASVLERGLLAEVVSEGRAVAWRTKAELGALLGRDAVAVCAIEHAAVAEQVVHARRVADAVIVMAQQSRSGDAWMSREVR